jgi:DNA topoisomerase I
MGLESGPKDPTGERSRDAALRTVGLRYVTDRAPGIERRRARTGFRYVDSTGRPVRDASHVDRIRALAIPPAWTDVWISPDPNGHLQATGRDAKGRKQSRYHERWRELRDESKYERMAAFGAALPRLRARVSKDLSKSGLPRDKVIATIVNLLERTLIRVGNEEYARHNASFGLTTLRERHVQIQGAHLRFHFRGKSGKEHSVDVSDPKLARIVKRLQELPGQHLFHFRDADGVLHPLESGDVNAYLREATGDDFTAKDFRTWHGTLLAATTLAGVGRVGSPSKRHVVRVLALVAARLGNTPAVCRKSYVHPVVISSFLRGRLAPKLGKVRDKSAQERALIAFLARESARGSGDLVKALDRSVRALSSRRRAA